MDFRTKIIEELTVIQKKETQDRNVFKARAYGKVIQQLKAREEPVTSMEDLHDVVGIGEKIREKIAEILRTGSLEKARMIKADTKVDMFEALTQVYGIGPVKAKALMDAHTITSMDQFRKMVEHNPKLLNEKQKIGLKYYEDLLERIPRKEMLQHQKSVCSKLHSVSDVMHCDVVGSFRRGAEDSGDIDVLIGYPKTMTDKDAQSYFSQYVQKLIGEGYITDVLALGPKKCMAICKGEKARRLDLLLTNAQEYPYALLYFTGSDKFNIQFRKRAMDKGYTLNEHGLQPIREGVADVPFMKDELAIFEFLEIPYVEPEKRSTTLTLKKL